MDDNIDKLKQFLDQVQTEHSKVQAAECLLEARCKEMEAAVHVGDWAGVERARNAAVMAFENFIDARLTGTRLLKRQADKF